MIIIDGNNTELSSSISSSSSSSVSSSEFKETTEKSDQWEDSVDEMTFITDLTGYYGN